MLLRSFLALVLTLTLAAPASAEVTGVYAGVKLFDSYQTQWGGGLTSGTASQNTVGLGFMLGYDFYSQSDMPIRAELEYAFRSQFTSEGSTGIGTDYVNSEMQMNMHTLLASAYYDFYNESIFTPYVGAGIGMAFLDGHHELSFNGTSYGEHFSDTVFAWHAGAGVGIAVTDSVTADLGYRYLGTGTAHSEVAGSDVSTDLSAHEFSVGVRFGF